jgi:hypothetical protein
MVKTLRYTKLTKKDFVKEKKKEKEKLTIVPCGE